MCPPVLDIDPADEVANCEGVKLGVGRDIRLIAEVAQAEFMSELALSIRVP
jgi:hypothetical protein